MKARFEFWKQINVALSLCAFVAGMSVHIDPAKDDLVPYWISFVVFPVAFGVTCWGSNLKAKGQTLAGVWSASQFKRNDSMASYFFGTFWTLLAGLGGICSAVWKGEAEFRAMLPAFFMGLGGQLGVWLVSSQNRKDCRSERNRERSYDPRGG
jgi:hypothetical protein